MLALAALVLLASSTVRAEDLLAPGTMICTCTPAASTVPSVATAAPAVAVEDAPAPPLRSGTWGVAAGATSLALFGGSFAAHLRSNDVALAGDASHWNTASTAMLIGGAAMAGFSAAFFVLRF
jgi:hypothetical protein